MDTKVKLASYNVRGLKNDKKRRELFSYMVAQKYDIVCLQETHCEAVNRKVWEKDWKGKIFHSFGTNRSKGCAILINETMTTKNFQAQENLENGRIVKIEFENDDEKKYYILCVYAPNDGDERKTFFNRM